eukprot:3893010-Amphidinium_carterae.1
MASSHESNPAHSGTLQILCIRSSGFLPLARGFKCAYDAQVKSTLLASDITPLTPFRRRFTCVCHRPNMDSQGSSDVTCDS